MNDAKRIAEIREREKRATGGPWAWFSYGEKCYAFGVALCVPMLEEHSQEPMAGYVELAGSYSSQEELRQLESDAECVLACEVEPVCECEHQSGGDDMPFIAHARSDIPWLLEKVEDLHGKLDRLDRLSEIELLAHDVCWNNCSPARLKELVRENPLARSTAAAAQEKP